MDGAKPDITKKNTNWTKRIDERYVEVGSEEKAMVLNRYEKVLNILKSAPIWYKNNLNFFKYILDKYLEAYLQYIPNGPFFNDIIPTETKENILSLNYDCDSQAFVGASVCQEWKEILENGIKGGKVIVGESCSSCKEFCYGPGSEATLKAAATHKLDVHLVVDEDVTEIDKELVTDALTSVSKFTVLNHHSGDMIDYLEVAEKVDILSIEQFEHLFERISKEDKVIEEVKLAHLNLQDLNQDRLANSLLSKIKKLTLDEVALDVETFIAKFQQDSVNFKLTHLTLRDFDFVQFPDNSASASLGTSVADALCKVENVKLCGWTFVFIKCQMMGRLLQNILSR